jgi:hypothetical protein
VGVTVVFALFTVTTLPIDSPLTAPVVAGLLPFVFATKEELDIVAPVKLLV